jgi:hypothetical protein
LRWRERTRKKERQDRRGKEGKRGEIVRGVRERGKREREEIEGERGAKERGRKIRFGSPHNNWIFENARIHSYNTYTSYNTSTVLSPSPPPLP